MAEVAGKNGYVTYTNFTAGAKNWSINYVSDPLDTTDYGDSGLRTYIHGLKGWSATVTANWDSANTAAPGDTATLSLRVTTGSYYSGSGLLTGMDITAPVDGLVEVTYSFQGSGALSIT